MVTKEMLKNSMEGTLRKRNIRIQRYGLRMTKNETEW